MIKRELWALTHWPGSGSLKYLCGCSPVLLPRPWPPLQGPNKNSEWINPQRNVRLKKLFLFQKRVTKVSLYILLKQQELWEEEGEQEQNKRCQILSRPLYILTHWFEEGTKRSSKQQLMLSKLFKQCFKEPPEILMTALFCTSNLRHRWQKNPQVDLVYFKAEETVPELWPIHSYMFPKSLVNDLWEVAGERWGFFPCFQLLKWITGPEKYMKSMKILPSTTVLLGVTLRDVTWSLVGKNWIPDVNWSNLCIKLVLALQQPVLKYHSKEKKIPVNIS